MKEELKKAVARVVAKQGKAWAAKQTETWYDDSAEQKALEEVVDKEMFEPTDAEEDEELTRKIADASLLLAAVIIADDDEDVAWENKEQLMERLEELLENYRNGME